MEGTGLLKGRYPARSFLGSLWLLFAVPAHAATVELGDFLTDRTGDARPAFEQALQALAQPGNDRLHIAPGTYRLSAPVGSDYHLVLQDMSGKRIDGAGATLMFTEAKGGLLLQNLSGCTIAGLTFNWDPAPHLQGTVLTLDGDFLTLAVDDPFRNVPSEYFDGAERVWATPHEQDGSRLSRSGTAVIAIDSVRVTANGNARLHLSPDVNLRRVQPGTRLVVEGRYEAAHAMTVTDTHQLTLTDLNVLASPSMAVLATAGNEDLSVRGVQVMPDAARKALVSTNADGIHVVEPIGSARIENNRLIGLQDDAIVVALRGAKARLDASGRTLLVQRGSSRLREGVTVEAAVPGQGLLPLGTAGASTPGEQGREIQLSRPEETIASLPRGRRLTVFSVDSPARVTVSGNDIANVRARGIRINYPSVQVISNRVADTTGPALLAAPILPPDDTQDPQYAAPGLVVRDNDFILQQDAHSDSDPSSGLVEIAPLLPTTRGAFGYLIRNVELSGNRFSFSAVTRPQVCAISLIDVDGVKVSDNREQVSGSSDAGASVCGIYAQHVADYDFSGNALGTEDVTP